jgi:hypothetical protein
VLLPPDFSPRSTNLRTTELQEINIKLPPQLGFQLPPTSGNFGYAQAEIVAQSAVLNVELLHRYKQQKALEAASVLSTKDARDVVVFAVSAGYFQVVASQASLAANADPLPEVSASSFFVYALAWGIDHKLLDRKVCLPVVKRGWRGLLSHVYEDGRLGSIQPIGAARDTFQPTSSYV